MENTATPTLYTRNFTLVVIGQIISIFGNNVLRFALPLYIFDQTGSEFLLGLVSALAFIPMIIMSPIGGIVADRVNKQKIMVVLDFCTAALAGVFLALEGTVPLVPLVVAVMMILYGIQGAYAPAVQASIPLLVHPGNILPANAVVNVVNSLAGLVGPVAGGILYAALGLKAVMVVGLLCFAFSAILELFIKIPHKRLAPAGKMWNMVKSDMGASFHFMLKEKPAIAKVSALVVVFNLFLTCLLIVGMPVLVKKTLGLGDPLYGAAQGVLAFGGLLGGILAGTATKKLHLRNNWVMLFVCSIGFVPIGIAILAGVPPIISYGLLLAGSLVSMAAATLFTVGVMAYVQTNTPTELVGKVVSCVIAMSMCAQPLGNLLYGTLFQLLDGTTWAILLGASAVSIGISLAARVVFRNAENEAPAATPPVAPPAGNAA